MRLIGALVGLLALSWCAVAGAEPTSADVDLARKLFDEARQRTSEGRDAEACTLLEKSQSLDPSMGTEFYWAECLEKTKRLVAAREHFLHVAEVARASGRNDRAAFALERLQTLEPRVPTLVVRLGPGADVPGLVVEVSGAPISSARIGDPLRIDPGTVEWSARAPGKASRSGSVAVAEGAQAEVVIPALDDVTTDGPVAPPIAPTPPPPNDEEPTDDTQLIAGLVVGGAGVVGIGIGSIFGALALGAYGDSEGGPCDAQNRCTSEGLDLRDSADLDATVSTIGFIAGGALLAGGAVLVLSAPSAEEASTAPTRVRVGAAHAEVEWAF